MSILGADKEIRNNEKKRPYDLARNPEAASFLKDRAGGYEVGVLLTLDNFQ